jgi:hypothetical protein
MTDPAKRDLEQEADEARRKLAEAEHGADEVIEHAAEHLRELSREQKERAERLKKEVREPTGSPMPSEPEDKNQE